MKQYKMKRKCCKNIQNSLNILMKNSFYIWCYRSSIFNYLDTGKSIIILICLVTLVACNGKRDMSLTNSFDVEKAPQKMIKMQEVIPNFTIVPLETNDESLIQYVKKVILYDDLIFILDDQGPLVAIFDKKGKFVQTIGRKGNGPGEFYFPTDFIIDPKRNQLELFDGFRRQILIYDLQGNFRKRIPISVDGHYFIKFDDETYLIYTNMWNEKRMPYKLLRIDKTGKLISKELPYSEKMMQTVKSPFVQIGADRYIFSEHSNDTIFEITRKKIRPFIYINLGKGGMPLKNRMDINSANATARKYFIKKGSPMILSGKLIIQYSMDLTPKYLCFDPPYNNVSNYYTVTNNYDFAFGTPEYSSNNKLIGIIHPSSINLHKKDGRYALLYRVGDKIPEIETLRKNLKEMDNPCLIIWNN